MSKINLVIISGLVIILIAAIYFFADSSNRSQTDSHKHDKEIEHSSNSRTRGAYREDSSERELKKRERPRSTRRPSRDLICFALKDSVPVLDSEDHIVSYISPGTFYRLLDDNSYLRKIELDSTLTGYVDREDVRVTRANKPYVEQLLDAWSTTTSDLYKTLIDQLPDTMMVKQRSDSGPRRPDEPLAFIKLVYKTRVLEKRNEWQMLIDTWDTLADKFPDKEVGDLPTTVVSKFEKADIYKTLQMSDSVIAMYESIMIENQDIEYNSPDLEGHYYADRWAFVQYISYISGLDMLEEELMERLNRLYSGSSEVVRTLIKLQLNKVYFKRGDSDKALENFLSIIQGPPHIWYSFKTYGELRHAALYQMKNLGVEYFGPEYAIRTLDTAQSLTEVEDLIWLSNYLKGMCYLEFGDTISARRNFAHCLSNPFQRQGREISLSIVPYSHEPTISKRKAIEVIGEISEL